MIDLSSLEPQLNGANKKYKKCVSELPKEDREMMSRYLKRAEEFVKNKDPIGLENLRINFLKQL